jgi:hypothetical protein
VSTTKSETTTYERGDLVRIDVMATQAERFLNRVVEYHQDFEMTVKDAAGDYVIGSVFWDSEVEKIRIDFARYGER